jgi:hypothetical protein
LSNVEEKFEQFEKNLKTEKCVNCLHQVIVDYKIVGTDRSQKMKTSKKIFFYSLVKMKMWLKTILNFDFFPHQFFHETA